MSGHDVVAVSTPSEGVARVELDDPARYNALTTAMVAELREVFANLRDDRSVRVVILSGRGRGFCAGANMTGDDATPPEAQNRGPVGAIHFIQDNLAQLMLAIHDELLAQMLVYTSADFAEFRAARAEERPPNYRIT